MSLYKEGKLLLESTKIVDALESFGKPTVGGSYRYRTMVDRDIDIDVKVGRLGISFEERTDMMQSLISLPGVRGIKMADLHHYPDGAKHAIDGIWFGVSVISPVSEERWNIDVWFIVSDNQPSRSKEITRRLMNLTDNERKIIVSIKQVALEAGVKQKGHTSMKIYDAVLYHGVQTYEDYIAHESQEMKY